MGGEGRSQEGREFRAEARSPARPAAELGDELVGAEASGVENVAEVEEILKELRDEMLDEIGAIERELIEPQVLQ